MILLLYVTHNNEINSLKFVLDLLKSGALRNCEAGGVSHDNSVWEESRKLPNLPRAQIFSAWGGCQIFQLHLQL
jgi:hypothetical protein